MGYPGVMDESAEHRRGAEAFLAAQLGADAPRELRLLARFDGGELEGEGAVSIYGFTLARGGQIEECFAVAGETESGYYPAWGLSPEQMYSVHLGTRFMLVMEVAQVPPGNLPADAERQILDTVASAAPGETLSEFSPAAAFTVDGRTHAVCRLRVAGEAVYAIGLDAPPGIYRLAHLPPHAVYRLHLGNLIRAEPAVPEDDPMPARREATDADESDLPR